MKHEEVERAVDNLSHKKNRRRRGIGISKRKLTTIFVVLGIAFVLTASAGILDFFGVMNIEADVKQSVVWDGDGEWHDWDDPIEWTIEDPVGGCQYCNKTKIWNRACVEGELDLVVDIWGPGGSAGVTTYEWILPGDWTIKLENKDGNPDWNVIDGDGFYAYFTFNPCCPEFCYDLDAYGLTEDEYILIYYADQDPRFSLWGGNPALKLGVFTPTNGEIHVSNKCIELNGNLPYEDDWNIAGTEDYRITDGYEHGKGAKIWLIPSSDWQQVSGREGKMTAWHQSQYLFETDLIIYLDCELIPPTKLVKPFFAYCDPVTFPYLIGSNEQICLIYCVCFDWAIQGGTYNIQTKLVPLSP